MIAQSIPLAVMLLAVLAGMFLNNRGLRDLKVDLQHKFDGLDARMARLEAKVDDLGTKVADISTRLAVVETKVTAIETRVNAVEFKLITIEADLRQFYQVNGRIEARMEAVEKRAA